MIQYLSVYILVENVTYREEKDLIFIALAKYFQNLI